MQKTLHQQTGLTIKQNTKNGFTVITLHYTADPTKRSRQWKKEAHQGMSDAKFEQEYEINYSAMLGEKVFPEIKSKRDKIVVNCPFVDGWPTTLTMWGGFDYGARNPSSFHVYTVVDQVIYAVWELYEPCKNMIEFAKRMKECPYWNQIHFISCDPDMGSFKQRDMKTGFTSTILQQFLELGINKLVPASNDETAWLAAMRKHWGQDDPTFKIIGEACPMMIMEFEEATYVQLSDRQLETSDYREKLVDKRNHALDDCKYFMNSHSPAKVKKIVLPNLISRFKI